MKDFIKNKFNPQPEEWDKDALWLDIEKELPKKKERRRFIFWIFGASIFAILFITGDIFYTDKNLMPLTSDFNIESENGNEEKDNFRNEIMTQRDSSSQDIAINSTKKTSDNNNKIIDHSKNIKVEKKTNGRIIHTVLSNKTFEPIQNETIKDNKKGFFQTIDQNIETTFKPIKTTELFNLNSKLSPIAFLWYDFLIKERTAPSIEPSFVNNVDSLDVIKTKKKKIFELSIAGFYGSHSNVVKSNIPSMDGYTQLHNDSKEELEELGFELLAKSHLNKYLRLGIGINYQVINEYYTGTRTEKSENTFPSDSSSFFTFNGLTIYVEGERKITTTNISTLKTPVSRTLISIPLHIALHLPLNNFAFTPYAQFNFNILHKYRGRAYMLDENLSATNDKALDDIFKTSQVHSYTLGIDVSGKIDSRFRWNLGAYHRRQLNSSFLSELDIEEKYHSIGLKFGLSYSLGSKK